MANHRIMIGSTILLALSAVAFLAAVGFAAATHQDTRRMQYHANRDDLEAVVS